MIVGSRLAGVLALVASAHAGLTMPSLFGDNMVQQTNSEYGARDFVWGWADAGALVTLNVTWGLEGRGCTSQLAANAAPIPVIRAEEEVVDETGDAPVRGPQTTVYVATAGEDGFFRIQVNPGGSRLGRMAVQSGSDIVTAENVTSGDVFLCSGQSNMVRNVNWTFNASAEAAASVDFPFIKLFTIQQTNSSTPQRLPPPGQWQVPSPETVLEFSAVCWLSARHLSQIHTGWRPLGLIWSAYGDTPIEAWMSPEQLAEPCPQPNHTSPEAGAVASSSVAVMGPSEPSCLWNAMIYPLQWKMFRSIWWYQGEANAGSDSTASYACKFAHMINGWRDVWNLGDIAFQFVQLAPYFERDLATKIRLAQAETLPRPYGDVCTTGMAVAIDQGDRTSPSTFNIHPRNKTEVGRRLALATAHAAYALQEPRLNWTGPVITSVSASPSGAGLDAVLAASHATALRVNDTQQCIECCAPVNAHQPTAMVQLCAALPDTITSQGPLQSCVNGSVTAVTGSASASLPVQPAMGSVAVSFASVPPLPGPGWVHRVQYAATDYPECVLVNNALIAASPIRVQVNLTAAGPGAAVLWSEAADNARRARETRHPLWAAQQQRVQQGPPSAPQSATLRGGPRARAAPSGAATRYPTPPRGTNSWNAFHAAVSERLIRSTMDSLVSSGLAAVGFTSANIDDGWQVARFPNGTIIVDPVRFPTGMQALADYAHHHPSGTPLQFGIYTAQREFTCQKRPGSYTYEYIDGKTYCDWGIDYVKIDHCGGAGWPEANTSWLRFQQEFDQCLANFSHPIFQSVESCGQPDGCGQYIAQDANSWRVGSDIQANWAGVMTNAEQANVMQPVEAAAQAAGGGHFNDADMLEVGDPGLTLDEQRTHFAIWALLMPPLLISSPLKGMDPASMDILLNHEVLAAHSDPLAVQGRLVSAGSVIPTQNQVWAKNFSNGDVYVVAVNSDDDAPASLDIDLSMVWVPSGTAVAVRDLWTHTDNGTATGTFTAVNVPPHGCAALRLSPQ